MTYWFQSIAYGDIDIDIIQKRFDIVTYWWRWSKRIDISGSVIEKHGRNRAGRTAYRLDAGRHFVQQQEHSNIMMTKMESGRVAFCVSVWKQIQIQTGQ